MKYHLILSLLMHGHNKMILLLKDYLFDGSAGRYWRGFIPMPQPRLPESMPNI